MPEVVRVHLSRLPIRQNRRDELSRRSLPAPPPGQVEYLTLDAVAIPAQYPTDAPGLVIVVEAGVIILQRNITQKAHIPLHFHEF
jgi:hypothetical protein